MARRFWVVTRLHSLAIGLAALLCATAPASATVVAAMDIEEMAQLATHVVQGTVISVRAEEFRGRIERRVRVALIDCFKRACADWTDVDVLLPGGQLGGLAQSVPGTPALEVGQEVVLFLWWNPHESAYRVLSLAQGAFQVRRGPGAVTAVSDRSGLERAVPGPRGLRPALEGDVAHRSLFQIPLIELAARVRAASAIQPPALPQEN